MSPLLAAAISVVVLAQEPSRLIAASNVRLRSTPAETAEVVASVPLGTALVQLESGGDGAAWVRLRMADGRDGWMPSRLARKFTAQSKVDVTEGLIKERLGRTGDSFPARVELVDFIDRVRLEMQDPETSGRFAVHWLTAMAQAVKAIPSGQAKSAPYATFLTARKPLVDFDESGSVWMLRHAAIIALHDQEKDTSSADDIAWIAAQTGFPGECESWLPCYVRLFNLTNGEYLRRHSAGRHVEEAIAPIVRLAIDLPRMTIDRARDCRELMQNLTPLRAAIGATRASSRQAAVDALDKVAAGCPR